MLPPSLWRSSPIRDYGREMSKNPDFDDKDLIHEHHAPDPLAQVYSEMVTPDIEEINEHAASLAEAAETETDKL